MPGWNRPERVRMRYLANRLISAVRHGPPVWVPVLTSLLLAFSTSSSSGVSVREPHPSVTSTPTAATEPSTRVWLTFESPVYKRGDRLSRLTNRGVATTALRVIARNGGELRAAATIAGTGMRLPVHGSEESSPTAILQIINGARRDQLDPGTHRLTFRADFKLDKASGGSVVDNGDNLVQRGLYVSRSQYKLQVDDRRPSCRVKGARGSVVVTSTMRVPAGRWFRVWCDRSGGTVTLTLTSLRTGVTRQWHREVWTGSLTPASLRVPLSVGGKLRAAGRLDAESDQFNGVVDNVVVKIG